MSRLSIRQIIATSGTVAVSVPGIAHASPAQYETEPQTPEEPGTVSPDTSSVNQTASAQEPALETSGDSTQDVSTNFQPVDFDELPPSFMPTDGRDGVYREQVDRSSSGSTRVGTAAVSLIAPNEADSDTPRQPDYTSPNNRIDGPTRQFEQAGVTTADRAAAAFDGFFKRVNTLIDPGLPPDTVPRVDSRPENQVVMASSLQMEPLKPTADTEQFQAASSNAVVTLGGVQIGIDPNGPPVTLTPINGGIQITTGGSSISQQQPSLNTEDAPVSNGSDSTGSFPSASTTAELLPGLNYEVESNDPVPVDSIAQTIIETQTPHELGYYKMPAPNMVMVAGELRPEYIFNIDSCNEERYGYVQQVAFNVAVAKHYNHLIETKYPQFKGSSLEIGDMMSSVHIAHKPQRPANDLSSQMGDAPGEHNGPVFTNNGHSGFSPEFTADMLKFMTRITYQGDKQLSYAMMNNDGLTELLEGVTRPSSNRGILSQRGQSSHSQHVHTELYIDEADILPAITGQTDHGTHGDEDPCMHVDDADMGELLDGALEIDIAGLDESVALQDYGIEIINGRPQLKFVSPLGKPFTVHDSHNMFREANYVAGINNDYYHQGLDIDVEHGDDVFAPLTGEIFIFPEVDGGTAGMGNVVMILTDGGVAVQLGHLQDFNNDLKPGDIVTAGDFVARAGGSGAASGSVLDMKFGLFTGQPHPFSGSAGEDYTALNPLNYIDQSMVSFLYNQNDGHGMTSADDGVDSTLPLFPTQKVFDVAFRESEITNNSITQFENPIADTSASAIVGPPDTSAEPVTSSGPVIINNEAVLEHLRDNHGLLSGPTNDSAPNQPIPSQPNDAPRLPGNSQDSALPTVSPSVDEVDNNNSNQILLIQNYENEFRALNPQLSDEQATNTIEMLQVAVRAYNAGARVNPIGATLQFVGESGYGTSELYRKSGNPFGLTVSESDPDGTYHYDDGNLRYFKNFDSLDEAFQFYIERIENAPHYEDAVRCGQTLEGYLLALQNELGAMCEVVKAHGATGVLSYAETSEYITRLTDLNARLQFDKIVTSSTFAEERT